MRRIAIRFSVAVLLVTLLVSAVHAKTAAELMSEGRFAEEVEGNLDTAIGIYQQVIADTSAPRNLVAQALYQQGMCYQKKRNEAKAREVFQYLMTNYQDQTKLIEKVKPMLDGLGEADPASLMPPETLVYVEIGSPGQQVATILNMLKGTPLEDPLQALHLQGGWGAGGDKNAAQMMNALFNPAMTNELQKIRGIGVGITEIGQQNPSAIIVLYPGQSQMLKGIFQMAMSALGQAAQPVEGMQSVTFGDGGGAAYDDTVLILATPSPRSKEMLQWSIKQYKGQTRLPSLASDNKSFTKISKQARQQNALTLWANVDEVYARLTKMMPADQIPQQMRIADAFVDIKNIEDLIATLSLRETGLALEANVNFKPGYQSIAYSMIRTPNLNKAVLKAVPADAVALISLTLGEAGTPQALAASQKINEALGVDLGSQIFGNVQQITLFAMPLKDSLLPEGPGLPPIARSIGLAVTSRNPQQTQQLLMKLLQTAQLIAADSDQTLPTTGRYELALANGMKVFGHTDQASNTMMLSLNPQFVETSVSTLRQNTSVLSGGRLQDTLATLSPTTSKLVLVNVGGALQLASQNMQLPSDEMAKTVRQSVDELIQATQKTTVRLQTSEEADSFGIRLSLSDLPPMNQLVGPISELARMREAMAHMAATGAKGQIAVGIPQASRAPAIDGNVDDAWAGVRSHTIDHVTYSPVSSEADLSADFKAMYDKQALYILVNVVDDQLTSDSREFWLDDGVEIFIDADNSKSDTYDENDYQYHFDWDSSTPAVGESHHDKTSGVQYAFAKTDKGYRLEVKLPWSTLGATPTAGMRFGLDVQVNDDDDGGDRDTKRMWYNKQDIAWQEPSSFGTAELSGLVGWWKLDETDGTTAADSSGNGHNATVQGNAKWQPKGGRIGGAIALDGDGDYLEVADESAFDATAGVTVAAWIQVNTFDKRWQAVIAKGDSAWRVQRYRENNSLEFACTGLHIEGGNGYGSLFGSKEITRGEWHHVVGFYDGKRMYLYVDGALDASQDASGPIGTNDEPVLIGENSQQRDRFWNGLIDDVRVYNFGLTEAQVQQLYREAK